RVTNAETVYNISSCVVPLIVLAECCSWYAVITTDYLGNAIENSIWAVTFLLIAVALLRLVKEFRSAARGSITVAFVGAIAYLTFFVLFDVPTYFDRWQAAHGRGNKSLRTLAGLHRVSPHCGLT